MLSIEKINDFRIRLTDNICVTNKYLQSGMLCIVSHA